MKQSRIAWALLAIYRSGPLAGAARDALRRVGIAVCLERNHYEGYTNVIVLRGKRRDARVCLVLRNVWRRREPMARAHYPWSSH